MRGWTSGVRIRLFGESGGEPAAGQAASSTYPAAAHVSQYAAGGTRGS
jgi:hypothetical protein